jgi:2-polyprenyl-6-methoxyphenol hydroxylase-like FAD-dependent oxidoreductase
MGRRAVTIGGSVAGLAAAIGLARRGWSVTVIERDVAPTTNDGDEAFLMWDRRNVPQFRQPHAFSARSRNLLLKFIPEAVDWMLADGIEEVNLFKMLAPPDMWTPEDDAYTGLWTRRPAFELALRRVAEAEPGVTIFAPSSVRGLITADQTPGETPLHVRGVVLDDGTTIEADVVIDGAGRRSPVSGWLADRGVDVPFDIQDCGGVYYARYYRLRPDAPLSLFGILALREEIDDIGLIGFPGDHNTFGFGVFARPDDEEIKVIRQSWAWDAVMASMPRFAPWARPEHADPLTDVEFMGGHQNIRRRFVVDGRPLVVGLLPVGDSLCTTNPVYGWGASMALTYAFAAVEALTAHTDDPVATAVTYAESVSAEADGVYDESAAMDRVRSYQWRHEEVPEWDRAEVERQWLIFCIAAGATRDPVLGRALLRRTNLLVHPATVLDDPMVVERAKNTRDILAAKAPKPNALTRADLLAAIAAAEPS